jgi:hypothetical protein
MNATNEVVSLISILVLVIFLFRLYPDFAVEKFRQEMFSVRDKLFDDARMGKIQFDDEAYWLLRSTMNGAIRFGHRINLPFALCAGWLFSNVEVVDTFDERFQRAISRLPEETKDLMLQRCAEMNIIVGKHAVFSSPFFALTALAMFLTVRLSILVTYVLGTKALQKVDQFVAAARRNNFNRFDTLALVEGQ